MPPQVHRREVFREEREIRVADEDGEGARADAARVRCVVLARDQQIAEPVAGDVIHPELADRGLFWRCRTQLDHGATTQQSGNIGLLEQLFSRIIIRKADYYASTGRKSLT